MAWAFVVDTDSYAGNFQRELCAYVIGARNDPSERDPYLKLFDRDCRLPLGDLSDARLVDPGDDDVHLAPCDLAATPGWASDGRGKVRRSTPDKNRRYKHPAYNSVSIFLQRKPTEEELGELLKRSLEFPTLPKFHSWDSRPRILGCRLIKADVLVQETVVPLQNTRPVEEPNEAVPADRPSLVAEAMYAASFTGDLEKRG